MKTVCEDIGSATAQCSSTEINIDFVTDICRPPVADAAQACLPQNQCSVLTPEALYDDWIIGVYDPPMDVACGMEDLGCVATYRDNLVYFYYECYRLGTPTAVCFQSISVGC